MVERLEYAFESSGLRRLRRSFQQVERDLEDIGRQTEDARERLQQLEQIDTRRMQRGLQQAMRSVTDLGDEAADSARRMERSFSISSEAVRSDIDSMSDALSSFTKQDAGVSLGGAGGGTILASLLGGAVGGAAVANPFEDAFRSIKGSDIAGVTDEVRDLSAEAEKAIAPMYVSFKETSESADRAKGSIAGLTKRLKTLKGVGPAAIDRKSVV